jgi:hypothetical protein
MGIWNIIGVLGTSLLSIWAIFKYIISQNYKLDDNLSKIIIEKIKESKSFKLEISNEFSINKKYPSVFVCLCKLSDFFCYFTRNERLLTAGWQSKETVSQIYFFRWQKSRIERFISESSKSSHNTNVMVLQPNGCDKLGQLDSNAEVFLDDYLYKDIEGDIQDMLDNNKSKTGCLLYGAPGTGKTRLVKYFSQKFNLPIYTIYLNPEYNNVDILMMFGSIPEKCIVLFEDFDNYFNKRECTLKNDNVKFTFDVIINALDGIYNDYKQVVFIMTANDISKIDNSIKHRSSRFKFVREILSPSFSKRLEILKSESLAHMTDGMTLDKIFFVDSLKGKYTEEEIKSKLNLNV